MRYLGHSVHVSLVRLRLLRGRAHCVLVPHFRVAFLMHYPGHPVHVLLTCLHLLRGQAHCVLVPYFMDFLSFFDGLMHFSYPISTPCVRLHLLCGQAHCVLVPHFRVAFLMCYPRYLVHVLLACLRLLRDQAHCVLVHIPWTSFSFFDCLMHFFSTGVPHRAFLSYCLPCFLFSSLLRLLPYCLLFFPFYFFPFITPLLLSFHMLIHTIVDCPCSSRDPGLYIGYCKIPSYLSCPTFSQTMARCPGPSWSISY